MGAFENEDGSTIADFYGEGDTKISVFRPSNGR